VDLEKEKEETDRDRTLASARPDANVSVRSVVFGRARCAEGKGFPPGTAWSLTGASDHLLEARGHGRSDAQGPRPMAADAW
jgi:hypothetical protein